MYEMAYVASQIGHQSGAWGDSIALFEQLLANRRKIDVPLSAAAVDFAQVLLDAGMDRERAPGRVACGGGGGGPC